MTDTVKLNADVREAIDQIEDAYEFMLAFAAQGRRQEVEAQSGSQIRRYLERFHQALDALTNALPHLLPPDRPGQVFAERFASDIAVMKSIIDLLISRENISSDMIDNTNGLIAVRALLTDLFFIDQVVLPAR